MDVFTKKANKRSDETIEELLVAGDMILVCPYLITPDVYND